MRAFTEHGTPDEGDPQPARTASDLIPVRAFRFRRNVRSADVSAMRDIEKSGAVPHAPGDDMGYGTSVPAVRGVGTAGHSSARRLEAEEARSEEHTSELQSHVNL